jgi:hypothetical protein
MKCFKAKDKGISDPNLSYMLGTFEKPKFHGKLNADTLVNCMAMRAKL